MAIVKLKCLTLEKRLQFIRNFRLSWHDCSRDQDGYHTDITCQGPANLYTDPVLRIVQAAAILIIGDV